MADLLQLPGKIINILYDSLPARQEAEKVIVKEIQTFAPLPMAGRAFVRMAGISGASAVMMAAYGAHAFNQGTEDEDLRLKNVFESGNKMHIFHSVALLGVPNTRRPLLVGATMAAGMLIFSGSCYYQAITGDGRIRKITPYGGMLLILSWLLMIL